MTVRVDFYILNHPRHNRDQYACRIIEKAYKKGRRVYLQTQSKEHATMLDTLLWTFRDQSFVPHGLVGTMKAAPIHIGYGDIHAEHNDILINLSQTISHADTYACFKRIIEIADTDPTIKQSVREHYKQYQSLNWDCNTHQIDNL